MPSCKAVFVVVVLGFICTQSVTAQTGFGAQGAETEPGRMQQWLVPSPAMDTAAHAVLFRPAGGGPFRLAVIAHASTQNVLRRAQMPQPEYRALAAFLTARGFANDVPNQVCAPQSLIVTAALFGRTARVPVTWLVAANDSYFSPELSRRLADAFRNGGDRV